MTKNTINILGIETSCDDTGVAIYNSHAGLLANMLHSQTSLHNLYGGVVPELASRDHIQRITPLIHQCLNQANIEKTQIDAIAYTHAPGLNGALLIGASVANGLAFSLNKPVIPIHHLEGHILSTFLSDTSPQTPFIALLVSGGHTQIILVNQIGEYQILGESLDDAAGEAFDKTAKMLGLPYPGGQHIAKLAQDGTTSYELPRPMQHSKDLNMSFSGLKTAVSLLIKSLETKNYPQEKHAELTLPLDITQNIAKSVEEAITDILVEKTIKACKQTGIKTIVVSGGVSANLTLRKKFTELGGKLNIKPFYPPLDLCTDSGAMIAIAGYYRYKEAKFDYSFDVTPRLSITDVPSHIP